MFGNKDKKKIETKITVKYNVGSKSHEEVFVRYALFGKWMVNNWRRIRVIDIRHEGNY